MHMAGDWLVVAVIDAYAKSIVHTVLKLRRPRRLGLGHGEYVAGNLLT